jgi:hypothetical protein
MAQAQAEVVCPHVFGPLTDQGCWYCSQSDGELVFSTEWDCQVHLCCIRKAQAEDPTDLEARIFAREFEL